MPSLDWPISQHSRPSPAWLGQFCQARPGQAWPCQILPGLAQAWPGQDWPSLPGPGVARWVCLGKSSCTSCIKIASFSKKNQMKRAHTNHLTLKGGMYYKSLLAGVASPIGGGLSKDEGRSFLCSPRRVAPRTCELQSQAVSCIYRIHVHTYLMYIYIYMHIYHC